MRKVRLLFLPPVDAGNTNAQSLNTREIALRLDRDRFEVTLLYHSVPDARLRGQPHIRFKQLPWRLKTLSLLREMTSGYDLIAYMDYSPASFVFVHLPRWMRGGARTMLHVESTGLKLENAPRMFSLLYRGVLPKCDDYSAITECVARELSASIGRPVRYILPVGVDVQLFSPESERNSSVVTVLFAATLVARKRPLLVLEAAQRFPAVKFRMIGPGRDGYEKLVADRIAELQLKNVTLEGPKSQAEIARAMRESDIFLLPSRTEGLPKVTLEAAASGLPCVVFRDYETPSVIDGVSGFQVGTAEEMMNKLAVLISDASLRERMSIAACKRAAHFEWDRVGPLWQGTYFDILSGGDVSPSLV